MIKLWNFYAFDKFFYLFLSRYLIIKIFILKIIPTAVNSAASSSSSGPLHLINFSTRRCRWFHSGWENLIFFFYFTIAWFLPISIIMWVIQKKFFFSAAVVVQLSSCTHYNFRQAGRDKSLKKSKIVPIFNSTHTWRSINQFG